MVKAVVLAPDLNARGGAERVALSIAAALRDLDMTVVIASPSKVRLNSLGEYFSIDLKGVEAIEVPTLPPGMRNLPNEMREIICETRMRKRISRLRSDVFVQSIYANEISGLAPLSYYYVHFPHTVEANPVGTLRGAYYRLARAYRKASVSGGSDFASTYRRILANSEFTASQVAEKWNTHADVLYPPSPSVGQGRTSRSLRILSVGRFQEYMPGVPHKRQDALIQAFRTMTSLHRHGWELHLAGSVGSQYEIERLRSLSEGLPVYFHADAHRDLLVDLYKSSAIYWHAQGYGGSADPFTQEHFGISVVEAMSAGLIPLVYDDGGPSEIVRPIGPFCRWNTLEGLRMATEQVAATGAHRLEEIRAACGRRAAEFSPEEFSTRIQQLIRHDLFGAQP
ncbi:glycosyltransferase [Yimella sp. cx-573]|nr:glycosyltransferase [Yimella sp. cx-573]